MDFVRDRILAAFVMVAIASGASAPASAQPCQPGWDIQFGQPGAEDKVYDSIVFDDGTGPALYICGYFDSVAGTPAFGIAKWDGRHWHDVGGGLTYGGSTPGGGLCLAVWDDGRGTALYVGGGFDHAGDITTYNIARWDGKQWESPGIGVNGGVFSLCVFDDGRGAALYAGGRFDRAAFENGFYNIARWDGKQWEALGDGLHGRTYNAYCMTTYDDGQGPALFVGGDMSEYQNGQLVFNYLARWDGHEWSSPKGMHLVPSDRFVPFVSDLLVYDDGSGSALYMTGSVKQEGIGQYFLKWDGQIVTAPEGIHATYTGLPLTMAAHDDGSGAALWVGGGEFAINSHNDTTLAKWDGGIWTAPESYPSGWIQTLTSFNDGFGSSLFVGGELPFFDGDRSNSIGHFIRWTTPHMALDHTPLVAGEPAQFSTTCSTPGRRIAFAYSTRGLGHFYVEQLGVALDLNHPHLAGLAVADADGHATLTRTLPPESAGHTLYMQAAEQGRKSEVIEAVVE